MELVSNQPEQYRAWANMIHMGKHVPVNGPPGGRFLALR